MKALDTDIKEAGNVTKKGRTYQFKNSDNSKYMEDWKPADNQDASAQ